MGSFQTEIGFKWSTAGISTGTYFILNIYINDLDDDIASKVLKVADYTKVFRKTKSDANRQHLQNDLNKLIEWSEKWQMLFNFGKCKCLHTGHGNEDAQYTMGGTVLNNT